MSRVDAAALFESCAAVPTAELDLTELLDELQGNPLAIELAAAQVAILSIPEVRAAMASGGELVLDHTDRPIRHRSLHACLQASWSLLSEGARDALVAVATFAGDIEPQHVRAVLRRLGDADGTQALMELVDGHVIVRQNGRLRLSQPARHFALQRGPRATKQRAEEVHGDWIAHRLGGLPRGAAALGAASASHATVLDDILLAGRRAIERRDWRTATTCALGAWQISRGTGPASPALALLDGPEVPLDDPIAMTWLRFLGEARRLTGDRAGSAQAFERAEELARHWAAHPEHGPWARIERAMALTELSRPVHAAKLLRPMVRRGDLDLGLCAHAQLVLARAILGSQDFTAAIPHARIALSTFSRLELPHPLAHAAYVLGQALRGAGQLQAAEAALQQAIATQRTLGNLREETAALRALAACQSDRGDHRAATMAYEACLAMDRRLGNRPMEIYDLCNLGEKHRISGDPGQAKRLYGEAIALTRRAGDQRMEALALAASAAADHQIGDLGSARSGLQKAARLAAGRATHEFQLKVYAGLCQLELDIGDLSSAGRWLQAMEPHLSGSPASMSGLVAVLSAQLAALQGCADLAMAKARRAIGLGRSTGCIPIAAKGWEMLAFAQQIGGEVHARESWQQALTLFETIPDAIGTAQSLCGIAEVGPVCGSPEPCVAERAEAEARRTGRWLLVARSLIARAEHAIHRGATTQAVGCLAEAEAMVVPLDLDPRAWLARRIAQVDRRVSGSVRD